MLILLCYILINRIFASEASNGSAVAIVIETNVSALYQTRIPSLQPSLIPIFRPFNFSEGEGVISFNKSQHNQSVTVGEIDVSSNKTEDSRSHIPTNQVRVLSNEESFNFRKLIKAED